eukprot:scaffold4895_cov59-Attheya_sp.AAC.1
MDEQGIDELSEIKILTDSEIEGLCKVVRRPGGTIPNPNTAVAGQPATVYASGENLAAVRVLRDLKQYEKDHVDPITEPTVDTKDWSATMEAIEEWLRGHLGVNKVPLAYVVRKEMEGPASADDPSAEYETVIDEMIAVHLSRLQCWGPS